jgi:hypothetical protein
MSKDKKTSSFEIPRSIFDIQIRNSWFGRKKTETVRITTTDSC